MGSLWCQSGMYSAVWFAFFIIGSFAVALMLRNYFFNSLFPSHQWRVGLYQQAVDQVWWKTIFRVFELLSHPRASQPISHGNHAQHRNIHDETAFTVPSGVRHVYKTGVTFDGRLDGFFLLPNVETANQRMLGRMKATLKRRYHHEASFSLSDC